MQKSNDNFENNNASSSSTATSSAFDAADTAVLVVEEDLKDSPTPLHRHVRRSDIISDDTGGDLTEEDVQWGSDRDDGEGADEGLSRRSKAQKNRRRFKFASLTGRSRPSYAMRLAKMASGKLNVSGSIKQTEAGE